MTTEKIKATITMGKECKPTIRVWLSDSQREEYVLEKGTQPSEIFNIVVMSGHKETHKEFLKRLGK